MMDPEREAAVWARVLGASGSSIAGSRAGSPASGQDARAGAAFGHAPVLPYLQRQLPPGPHAAGRRRPLPGRLPPELPDL